MKTLVIILIKGYQKIISPFFPQKCRFYPSCSQYFIDALVKYGFSKGVWKGFKRIIKCHPWHPGGYDPA